MSEDRVVLLDELTANRIAAGEVVERPASAVKELVENAIDAGATQVSVTLSEGGKKGILVVDNGCGMSRTDAILALQRHATSKIRTADDLFSIRTLGFRGEALPSIASVSVFRMTTKPPDSEHAIRLEVVGGEIVDAVPAAAPDGTAIEISDLFYNTPARLKFLKSSASEVGRIVEVVGNLAIAYPSVAFRVRQQTHESLASPGSGEPLAALAAVWGREIARQLVPVEFDSPGLRVTGHIATPETTRASRSHELFFVNRRPIKSRLLAHALEEAFRTLTPESRFPIAALFVEIDPGLVDVNVHPTKTEVKFTRDGDVHHAVSQAVKRALMAYGVVPAPRFSAVVPDVFVPSDQSALSFGGQAAANREVWDGVPRDMASGVMLATEIYAAQMVGNGSELAPSPAASPATEWPNRRSDAPPASDGALDSLVERPRPRPFAEQLREFRVLGQARNTYIIALTPDGIAVVDQHVAHERVLYERLTEKRFAAGLAVQRLVVPVTLALDRREALLLAEHCESFAQAGWDIAPFGGESFLIRAVPAVLASKPYERILRDMVEELLNQTVSRRLLVQRDHVTITNACKMAVKAGDPLSIAEMTSLLEQLAETENPYTCPHGRPIVVKIAFSELDKQFKRA